MRRPLGRELCYFVRMEEQPERIRAGARLWTFLDRTAIAGYVLSAILVLFLIWWLPARVPPGYLMPTIEGSVGTLPDKLPAIWVRSWPWQTSPPDLRVTWLLPGEQKVTVPARAKVQPGLHGRAVPVDLSLVDLPRIAPTQVLGIVLQWPGGSSSAVESSLWITARASDTKAGGARTIWASRLAGGAQPGVAINLAQHPGVVAISSPAPQTTPWIAARCVPGVSSSLATRLLQGDLKAKPRVCNRVGAMQAIVVTPPLPGGYTYYLWQPVLKELVNRHLRTAIVGGPKIAVSEPLTAFNWWRFATGGLQPGF